MSQIPIKIEYSAYYVTMQNFNFLMYDFLNLKKEYLLHQKCELEIMYAESS